MYTIRLCEAKECKRVIHSLPLFEAHNYLRSICIEVQQIEVLDGAERERSLIPHLY